MLPVDIPHSNDEYHLLRRGFVASVARRFRFSLRALLLATVVLGIFFGWLGNLLIRVRHQRKIVGQLTEMGAQVQVVYDYRIGKRIPQGYEGRDGPPPGPKLLRLLFGDDIYAN